MMSLINTDICVHNWPVHQVLIGQPVIQCSLSSIMMCSVSRNTHAKSTSCTFKSFYPGGVNPCLYSSLSMSVIYTDNPRIKISNFLHDGDRFQTKKSIDQQHSISISAVVSLR